MHGSWLGLCFLYCCRNDAGRSIDLTPTISLVFLTTDWLAFQHAPCLPDVVLRFPSARFTAGILSRLCAGAQHADGWLAPPACTDAPALPDTLPPLRLSQLLGSAAQVDEACATPAVRQAALAAAIALVGRLAAILSKTPAFPELFAAAETALAALGAVPNLHKVQSVLPPSRSPSPGPALVALWQCSPQIQIPIS